MTDSLEKIRECVIKCTKCGLSETRTNAVPGSGNFCADVIFVGEAPGRNEDKIGQPFVGAAGKRLVEALEDAGVSRDSIYITNVVKCRPQKNRIPSDIERDACSTYIQKEIQIIAPKIVCIMGNTAFGSILGGDKITKFRGKIIRKKERLYFVTIHPAATIYRQELFDTLKKDIKKVFQLNAELKKGTDIQVDIECTP